MEVMHVWHHHHHHLHLFLKRPFLPLSARIRCFSRYEVSPHIPEHYPFRVQTQLIHIILHTFFPSFPAPTRTYHPCHHHISTGRHPIISTLTFHMPKHWHYRQINAIKEPIIMRLQCVYAIYKLYRTYIIYKYSRHRLYAWPRDRCYDMQLAGLCTTTALVYKGMFSGAGYILKSIISRKQTPI